MATMNRNVNLEEINSDAFMGIPFLNHQTIGQKVIFWGSVVVAVIWNILGTFLFHINAGIIIALTLVPLAFGVAFGCNYNQDLSLLEYLKLILFKPATAYYTKPVEDLEQIKIAGRTSGEAKRGNTGAATKSTNQTVIRSTDCGAFVCYFLNCTHSFQGRCTASCNLIITVRCTSEKGIDYFYRNYGGIHHILCLIFVRCNFI